MSIEEERAILSERLAAHGLGHRCAELLALARPSIRLQPVPVDDDAVDSGATKLGGCPDLPIDMAWPRFQGAPLAFVAQLAVQDFTPMDCEHVLPSTGILSFFFEATWAIEGTGPWWGWDVIHIPANQPLARRSYPSDLDDYARHGAATVLATQELTFAPWESSDVLELGLTTEEQIAYSNALLARDRVEAWPDDDVRWLRFRLLGQPDAIQGDMQLECEYRAYGLSPSDSNYGEGLREKLQGRARRWRLLFQADSYDAINMDWFGFGRLYYWITDDDLAARRFHRAIAATQR